MEIELTEGRAAELNAALPYHLVEAIVVAEEPKPKPTKKKAGDKNGSDKPAGSLP